MTDATVANYLNAIGGLLVLALGLLVIVPKARSRAVVAFATMSVGLGGYFALNHLSPVFHPPPALRAVVELATYALWTAGGFAMLLVFPARLERRELPLLVAGFGAALLVAIPRMVDTARTDLPSLLLLARFYGNDLSICTLYALFLILPLRFLRSPDAAFRRQAAFAATGLALFVGYQAAAGSFFDGSGSVLRAEGLGLVMTSTMLGVVLAAAGLWLVGAAGVEGRHARNVALVTLSTVLVGLIAVAADFRGGHGIARVLMTFVLGYGILRHSLLGLDVKVRWGISKTTVAAAFITIFFLASETAQQFFGATLGSTYIGIAAAGALVFAIAPLQRAAERLAAKAVPFDGDLPAMDASLAPREDAYRRALRVAIRSGPVTREDERHFLDLAHHLGIPPSVAGRIHDEVEREERSA